VEVLPLRSRVLRGNPLGDPADRELHVYLPPGFRPRRRLPALLALTGFTGTGSMLFNRSPWSESISERLDRLIGSGAMPPVVVAAPDCFNRLGGSQYMNSGAVGRYEDHLLEEVLPLVRERFGTGRWGVFGKSSGGYGAVRLAMRHGGLFEAAACHSGDMGFELCYLPDFPEALDRWRGSGGPAKWLKAMWKGPNPPRKKDFKALNALAMSAHYSPDPESPHLGVAFPFDLDTGTFRPEVWERWRENDPVRMAASSAERLRKLKLLYVDCGSSDEFALHWGARALAAELRRLGLSPVHEEFDDGHMNLAYRYDRSLPLLAKALS
jgi:S-formylglutathione hydrolase FrmB